MTIEAVYLVLFAVQVFVLSYYFPRQIVRKSRESIEQYPPEEYPGWYGWPIEKWHQTIGRYRLLTGSVFAVGAVIVAALITLGVPSELGINIAVWFGFTMLQVGCDLWRNVMITRRLKALRFEDQPVRSAQLTPRRVRDYVSRWHWGILAVSVCTLVASLAWLGVQTSPLRAILMAVVVSVIHVVFLRNARSIVQGQVAVPQLLGPMHESAAIERAVCSLPEVLIRVNLMCTVGAYLVVIGGGMPVLVALSAMLVADRAYELFRELSEKEADYWDMERFRTVPPRA